MNEPIAPRRSRLWWCVVALWAVSDLVSTLGIIRETRPAVPPLAAAAGLLGSMAVSLSFLLLPFALARRFPLGRERLARGVAVHSAAALTLAVVDRLWTLTAAAAVGFAPEQDPLARFLAALLQYALVAGVAHAVEYGRRFRQKEVAELRLRAELSEAELRRTQAELRVLKLELNPHFLFNSLHAIGALMHESVPQAERMLVRLSDLLRRALRSAGTQEVALEDELEFVRPFLEIEQARFGEALEVAWEVEEEALDVPVPHMILQPLVENAIKHGVAPYGGGRVEVAAWVAGERLEVEVRDRGAGPRVEGAAEGTGTGVANTRARLRQAYGEAAGFELRARPGGGAAARLSLPLHGEPAADPVPAAAPARGAAPAPARAAARGPALRFARMTWIWRAGLAVWFAAIWIAMFDMYRGYTLASGRVLGWEAALANGLAAALTWTGFLYLAFRLTRSHPLGREAFARNLRVHLGAGLLLATAVMLQRIAAMFLLQNHPPASWLGKSLTVGASSLLLYGLIAGVAHAVEYGRRFRQKEVAELRLRAELSEAELRRTQAELRVLKLELNPHFLFNSLHAIGALMHESVPQAERMLVRLSDLLRRALRSAGTQEVALEDELEFVRPFLEIEQARFGEALEVAWEVEEEALDVPVPHMILQPLVENAIKHGVAPYGGGRVEVAAWVAGERLEVEVRDRGAGPRVEGAAEGTGTGVSNTRARLRQAYGEAAGFELRARPGGGTAARLSLPLHQGPAHSVRAA